jgi:RNA polymerase sigma-70 factor (ECF subfamily)
MKEEIDDKQLLQQFAIESRREQVFHQIVLKYQRRIYWHIRKIVIDHDDTDDLTQETFIKAWKALKDFREDAQLFTWLYRIATNEALSFLRKKKSKNTISINEAHEELILALQSTSFFNGDALQMKLQKAILTLPEKQRIVFNMKYFDAMKYEEMSEILETSVGALKASYHHAVKKIEVFFEKQN